MDLKIIEKRKIWYIISILMFVVSILALLVFKLNLGIDFTGGSAMQVQLSNEIKSNVDVKSGDAFSKYLNENIANEKTGTITVQKINDKEFNLKFREISQADKEVIIGSLKDKVDPKVRELSFEVIGPTLGNELKNKTIIAIIVALIAIIAYVAFAFRKASYPIKSWKYGVIAIMGLLHDIVITVGVFSILGHFFKIEIDILFITALLTILGHSIMDTIVVYDRIRENIRKTNDTFDVIANTSINETLARSINTSVATLLSLFAVFFFGGESIRMFALALIIGITLGTYSSIFMASPLLVDLYKWEHKKTNKK